MVSIAFLFLCGALKALADLQEESGMKEVSWLNKWELRKGFPVYNAVRPWYYLWLYRPRFIERFPYSSTWLVWLTDKWHLYNAFRSVLTILAVVFYSPTLEIYWDALILWGVFSLGFNATYEGLK